ncbi:hypothetical protein GCM10023116_03760 [Kistimonas scapharcae]|uniref:Helix-turn-helix domain-containing protein n=1 Tax=Kistimonas scapharcae TaxID=1036133 RepID=A0ABP8UWZ7_9GAMM
MTRWITAQEYQRLAFVGKPPHLNTIWRWCKNGDLPAKKQGGTWLINARVLEETGNPLADMLVKGR